MNNIDTRWKDNIKVTTTKVFFWTLLWVLSVALLAFGPKIIWAFETSYTLIAVAINLFIGVKMILALKNNLDSLDELAQKIHRDAMAISLGASLVLGTCYEIFEDVKLIPFQPEISHLIMAVIFTYIIGVIIGTAKYR